MSIIYDALKKVEKSNGTEPNTDNTNIKKKKIPPEKVIFLSLFSSVVIILGVFAANMFFNFISGNQGNKVTVGGKPAAAVVKKAQVQAVSPAQTIKPVINKSPVSLPKETLLIPNPPEEIKKAQPSVQPPALVLSGIMYSPGSSFALINNRVVKIGDTIEGSTVVRITENEVELKIGDLNFKLSPNTK